ncbi:MAG: hypothetical protein ACD_20C00202G0009 [uncultured bacterium]|nr:MAG: hypothetical protein ACD_20C00202G0009 [uncultured bacterium]HBH18373.1 hypothetical protein [Cyanobacteria bacterium UBA9579]
MRKVLHHKKEYPHNSRNGFTFVEVMLSILILGIVAMYLAVSIPTSLVIIQETESISKATDLAQKYFENVKYELSDTGTYDNAASGNTPPVDITDDITNNGYFNVTTNVANIANDTIGGNTVVTLKQLDVTFKKANSSSPLVSLSTEIARPTN